VARVEALPEGLVEALGRPAAHPADAGASDGVETRQTHISHLYLTRERVYKLRKAVDLSFLSFATRDERNADCLSEVALNRRLAPDVYLGVAPVLEDAGNGFVLGPPGEACVTPPGATRPTEHCVVMRRLPADRNAKVLLERGMLEGAQVDRLAAVLARFHESVSLGRPAPWSPEAWLERVAEPVRKSFALARDAGQRVLDPAAVDRLEGAMEEILSRDRARFLDRREAGRVVDGHGDLHLDAVWFEREGADPVAIDCLEFDASLRRIDVAAELAFFAMDTAYRGRTDLAERLLQRYAALTDDYALYGVVDYHILHRALVRASVAAVAAGESEIDAAQRDEAAESARRHLAWAIGWLERPRRAGVLLTCGLPGTGKSTVAAAAAATTGGVVIASDRVRKHLAGVRPDAHPPDAPGGSLYGEAMTEAVYAGLLDRAEPVLASGRPVVLDATFARESDRQRVRSRCTDRGVSAVLLDVRCDEATTLARLRDRMDDPDRISDAGPAVHLAAREKFEPPLEWAPERTIRVETDDERWRETLRAALRATGMEETLG
jgi:aminoglycoside phosphotransferase family enzyme/predicted kinase